MRHLGTCRRPGHSYQSSPVAATCYLEQQVMALHHQLPLLLRCWALCSMPEARRHDARRRAVVRPCCRQVPQPTCAPTSVTHALTFDGLTKPRERAWGGREKCCHAAPPQHLGCWRQSDLSIFVARANQLSNPIAAVDKTFWLCGDAKRQKRKKKCPQITTTRKIKLGHLCRALGYTASTLQRAFVERGAPHRNKNNFLVW